MLPNTLTTLIRGKNFLSLVTPYFPTNHFQKLKNLTLFLTFSVFIFNKTLTFRYLFISKSVVSLKCRNKANVLSLCWFTILLRGN